MGLTRTQARDAILAAVKAAVASYGGTAPVLIWDDLETDQLPGADACWCRLMVKHTGAGQRTLGETGQRRFGRIGLAIVQVFTPFGDGYRQADALAETIQGELEAGSDPDGVWFRNVRANEVGKSGAWSQTNVVAEFDYDQIR